MKPSTFAATGLVAVAALVAPPYALAQQTDRVTVPASGEAMIRGDSVLAANQTARTMAYRDALRMQLYRLLDSLGANEVFPRLQTRARTYVLSEQVENEEREGNIYRVDMRLGLNVARLKADLEQLGYEIRTVGTDMPSVMVVVDEYFVNDPRSLAAQAQAQAAPPSAMTGRAAQMPDSAIDPFTRPEFREP